MNKTFKVASLFSGCGGLDLGFTGGFEFMGRTYEKLPTQVVFANDKDLDAARCYNSNLDSPRGIHASCIVKDIREISTSSIPDFDILLAGFPCQPFSSAGNRKGVEDNNGRGTLFEECERILREKIASGHKPTAFVFENVRGIMSSKMPDGTTVPDEIKRRMEAMGFRVSTQLICAKDYGVPQARYRVLIIGVDNHLPAFDFSQMDTIVKDRGIPSHKSGNYKELLLGSILQNLENFSGKEFWPYSATTQHMIDMIGPCAAGQNELELFSSPLGLEQLPKSLFIGKSWKDIPPELLPPRFKKIHDDPKKYHAPKFYRRFALGEINGTITASAQPENCGITHPFENRRYSVREIARIQSFPDHFLFDAIPLQARYKVIGNAVPPVLGWVIGAALINHITKHALHQ